MQLVKINYCTFIDIEKVCGLESCGNATYILMDNGGKIYISNLSLYEVKKIIENAIKEK